LGAIEEKKKFCLFSKHTLYPLVSMLSPHGSVSVNFGQQPFVFPIEKYIRFITNPKAYTREESNTFGEEIESKPPANHRTLVDSSTPPFSDQRSQSKVKKGLRKFSSSTTSPNRFIRTLRNTHEKPMGNPVSIKRKVKPSKRKQKSRAVKIPRRSAKTSRIGGQQSSVIDSIIDPPAIDTAVIQ